VDEREVGVGEDGRLKAPGHLVAERRDHRVVKWPPALAEEYSETECSSSARPSPRPRRERWPPSGASPRRRAWPLDVRRRREDQRIGLPAASRALVSRSSILWFYAQDLLALARDLAREVDEHVAARDELPERRLFVERLRVDRHDDRDSPARGASPGGATREARPRP
jgi:hypothetical protein